MFRHNPYATVCLSRNNFTPSTSVIVRVSSKPSTPQKSLVDDDFEPMMEVQCSGLSDSDRESVSRTPDMSVKSDCEDEGMPQRQSSSGSKIFYETLEPALPFFEYCFDPCPSVAPVPLQGLTRLFVGQLPYHITAPVVSWIMRMLTNCPVFHVEKIVRWTQNRRPCGCFHVYCLPEHADRFLRVDQTALCEQEGIWISSSLSERQVLVDHCKFLADNKESRAPLMPFQMITVQLAQSTYHRPARGRGRKEAGDDSRPAYFSQVNQ